MKKSSLKKPFAKSLTAGAVMESGFRYFLVACFLVAFGGNCWADAVNDLRAANEAAMQGKYAEAIELATVALDRGLPEPALWIARGVRGSAYCMTGQYDRGIEDLNEAVRLKSGNSTAFYDRGYCYLGKHDYKVAVENYDEAIRIKADYAGAFHNRGIAYYRMGQRDRALKDFEEAFRIDPKHQPPPSLPRDQ
jgi:tetratricopeptide (TPR) repeat protein